MGKESDDIDIALDDMLGEEFAALISKRLYKDQVAAGQIDPNAVKKQGYAVIPSNNEMSKSLETAVITIQGELIEIVNLRSEESASGSGVHASKIGTPEEDALRRDLTLNSLFYNINENKIEDCTNHGLDDLKSKIIRTPLEPV